MDGILSATEHYCYAINFLFVFIRLYNFFFFNSFHLKNGYLHVICTLSAVMNMTRDGILTLTKYWLCGYAISIITLSK